MTISQRAQRFWSWFDTARFGLSFMHEVDPDIQESMLMDLYCALQEYLSGLTFSIKVKPDGSSAHLIIWDDGSVVAKRRNKQLFQDCLSFPGWTFGTASGHPLQNDLPDLTDELEQFSGVHIDLVAVHAPQDNPRFLLFIYLPEDLERVIQPHLEHIVRLFIGSERCQTLIQSIVFAKLIKGQAPRGVPIGQLQSWLSRIQPAHPALKDPLPLFRDQLEELN